MRFWGDTPFADGEGPWLGTAADGIGQNTVLQGLECRAKVLRPSGPADLVFCRDREGLENLVGFSDLGNELCGNHKRLVNAAHLPQAGSLWPEGLQR